MVLSLCKHACKEVCDVKQGIDPYPLLARSCDRWWPDFVTYTACKRSIFELKRGKKAQCVWNRSKDLFKRKKYFGVRCTLMLSPFGRSVPSLKINLVSCCLRLMLLLEHCFQPQTMLSSREWEAELKCSATGNPRDRFRMLSTCEKLTNSWHKLS